MGLGAVQVEVRRTVGERGLVLCVEVAGTGGRWERVPQAGGQRGWGAETGESLTCKWGTGSGWEQVGVEGEGWARGC